MLLARRNNNQNWMSDFFDDFFDTDWTPRFTNATPAINVKEDKGHYTLEIAAPGLKKEYCRVNLDNDGNLCIKMENKFEHKETEKHERYLRREFAYTNFEQTFAVPDNVDKAAIKAAVNDGILSIELPKLTPQETAKLEQNIEIQ